MKELENMMKEHYQDMERSMKIIEDCEKQCPQMRKYGRSILTHLQETDMNRYLQLLVNENLYEKVLEREKQAYTRLHTIIEKQEQLDKVEDIVDFMERVEVRQRIKLEADSMVMREIILRPM